MSNQLPPRLEQALQDLDQRLLNLEQKKDQSQAAKKEYYIKMYNIQQNIDKFNHDPEIHGETIQRSNQTIIDKYRDLQQEQLEKDKSNIPQSEQNSP